jgi:hypothetical protein
LAGGAVEWIRLTRIGTGDGSLLDLWVLVPRS